MTEPGTIESIWKAVREHLAFRVAAVYGGAIWFVLQLLEVLGISDDARRRIALALGVAFPIVVGIAWLVWHWSQREPAAPGRRVAVRRWLGAAAAFLILGGGLAFIGPRLFGERVTPGADVIAVLPFSGTGSVAEYGVGLVDLLTANLDQVGPIRTVNARTVMHQWTERTAGATPDLDGALQIGRELGAGAVLWGSIAPLGAELRISAELHRTTTGELLARQQISAPEDSLLSAVDALTLAVLRDVWRSSAPVPDLRVSAITTNSPAAIRAYLRGERHYRASQWDSAIVAFEEAVRQDTTFALAMLRVSESLGWVNGLGDARAIAYAERAARFADRLPERERSLVMARLLHERQDQASIDSLESFVQRYPDDPMGWFMLGDARFHAQPIRPMTDEELLRPFERAIELDPSVTGEYEHPIDITMITGDSVAFERLLEPMRNIASPDEFMGREALRTLRWGSPDSVLPIVSMMARYAAGNNRISVLQAALGPVRARVIKDENTEPELLLATMDTAVAAMRGHPGESQVRRARLEILLMLGRTERALAEARDMATAGGQPLEVSRFIGAFALPSNSETANAAASALEQNGMAARLGLSLLLRQFYLAIGDVEASRRIAESAPEPVDPGMAAATRVVDAWQRTADGDTVGGLVEFKEAARAAPYAGQIFFQVGPAMLQYAALLLRSPETREVGERWLNYAVAFTFPIPIYMGMGQELERLGDVAGAATAYNHVIRLLDGADPAAQPVIDAARAGLVRLGRESGR